MRSRSPCFTVDVEDFYEGMKALGHDVTPPPAREPGVRALGRLLERRSARITLFVVGRHARAAGDALRSLAEAGHEIASHGPDHGRLPGERRALGDWLRAGREMVEDVIGRPVRGFRSPRFDVPAELDLGEFRDLIAEAGFAYVSDTSRSGPSSPVAELPIALRWHVPIGGGSYQRLIPRGSSRRSPAACRRPQSSITTRTTSGGSSRHCGRRDRPWSRPSSSDGPVSRRRSSS